MKRTLWLALFSFVLGSCAAIEPRERELVARALEALGGAEALARVRTISVKGTLRQWEPEQSFAPGGEPRFANDSEFTLTGDLAARRLRVDWVKKYAYPAPRTYTFSEIVTPDAGYVIGIDSTRPPQQALKLKPPAHPMSGLRLAATLRELHRASPSLLLEMRENPERVRALPDVVIAGLAHPAVGYRAGAHDFIVIFDPKSGLPARIRTLDYDNIWGDVAYDLVLSDWRTMGGIRIAASQRYELDGRLVQEARIAEVVVNPALAAGTFEPPAEIKEGAARPATGSVPYQWMIRRQFIGVLMDSDNPSVDTRAGGSLRLQELAPGVSHVVGGSHNSLLVEMADHLIAFDAPIDDAQSNWTISAARQKYPAKPIRYLVLTHHHMDHAGGLRAYLAQGATLVVGKGAAEHFRKVLAAPFTRNPHLAPRDLSRAQIIEVAERHVFSDGKREVSAHVLENPHASAYLMGYVSDARIAFVTDVYSPGTPLPPKLNPALAAVLNGVKKAGIQPLMFAGGHGSTAPFALLAALAGH
ncbi:MAG TPA: MBL fold metallo-hydrolase [Burkholderiales bacterium]|nr:MBL fold metallo-hydrolase [Burkholderiales bacterium]